MAKPAAFISARILNFGKNLLTTHDGRKPNHINP
jgi:hypothetical protein